MIVLSVGLPKSGSALCFNVTNDLLCAAGHEDVRVLKEKHGLQNILEFENCNVSNLAEGHLAPLLPLQEAGESFVVKTHCGPTPFALDLVRSGAFRVTCIHRDPRDVLLSAMDHGEKARRNGQQTIFNNCVTVEDTVEYVRKWLEDRYLQWFGLDSVLSMKYEDLLTRPMAELARLADFLTVDRSAIDLAELFGRYDKSALSVEQKGYLHFNVGKTERFKTAMDARSLEYCNKELGEYISMLGYQVE